MEIIAFLVPFYFIGKVALSPVARFQAFVATISGFFEPAGDALDKLIAPRFF